MPPLVCHLQWLTRYLDDVNQTLFYGAISRSEGRKSKDYKGNLTKCECVCLSALTLKKVMCLLCVSVFYSYNLTNFKHLSYAVVILILHNMKTQQKRLYCTYRTALEKQPPVFITHPVVSGRCKRISHPCPKPGSRCLNCNGSSDFH